MWSSMENNAWGNTRMFRVRLTSTPVLPLELYVKWMADVFEDPGACLFHTALVITKSCQTYKSTKAATKGSLYEV